MTNHPDTAERSTWFSEPVLPVNRDGIDYYLVWQRWSSVLGEKVVAFWREHEALPDAGSESTRLEGLVGVAIDERDRIAGVLTGPLTTIAEVPGERFHELRIFIAPHARQRYVTRHLVRECFWAMEAARLTEAIGIYMVMESIHLRTSRNQGVTPNNRAIFIGDDSRGMQRRIRYFSHATMTR